METKTGQHTAGLQLRQAEGEANFDVQMDDGHWYGIATIGTTTFGMGMNMSEASRKRVERAHDDYAALAKQARALFLAAPETAAERDRLREQQKALVEALEGLLGDLHHLANGAGPIKRYTPGELKTFMRALRDRAREALRLVREG